jgi:hypothetical protein
MKGQWVHPREFERICGLGRSRKWRMSIRLDRPTPARAAAPRLHDWINVHAPHLAKAPSGGLGPALALQSADTAGRAAHDARSRKRPGDSAPGKDDKGDVKDLKRDSGEGSGRRPASPPAKMERCPSGRVQACGAVAAEAADAGAELHASLASGGGIGGRLDAVLAVLIPRLGSRFATAELVRFVNLTSTTGGGDITRCLTAVLVVLTSCLGNRFAELGRAVLTASPTALLRAAT